MDDSGSALPPLSRVPSRFAASGSGGGSDATGHRVGSSLTGASSLVGGFMANLAGEIGGGLAFGDEGSFSSGAGGGSLGQQLSPSMSLPSLSSGAGKAGGGGAGGLGGRCSALDWTDLQRHEEMLRQRELERQANFQKNKDQPLDVSHVTSKIDCSRTKKKKHKKKKKRPVFPSHVVAVPGLAADPELAELQERAKAARRMARSSRLPSVPTA